MNAPTDGQARLDYFINERLAVLHVTRAQLPSRGGPNRSTLHKASVGTRCMSEGSLARLDEALGWAHGSSKAILAGGVPRTEPPQDTHVRAILHTVEHLVAECHAILGDARKLLTELLPAPADHAR